MSAPWADLHYFCDERWWGWHFNDPERREQLLAFKGIRVTLENLNLVRAHPEIMTLRNDGGQGLCEHPNGLRTGSNGGYQCTNLSVHLGAARVVLLGFDMRIVQGRTHWHGGHPVPVCEATYHECVPRFATLVAPLKARGVEVINATPGSAITAFPKMSLEAALACGHFA